MTHLICSRAHLCPVKLCHHKRAHEPLPGHENCGPAMPCYSDPSGEISGCIRLTEQNKITVSRRNPCRKCDGRGYTEVTEYFDIPEEK